MKRFGKMKPRGVAILMVLVSLALMMAIVTEISTRETMRYKLAVNERDALQAEALAQSGLAFAQLILTIQEPLQGYMAKFAKMGMQLPSYASWELFPLSSELLKGITAGDFFPSFDFSNDKNKSAPEPKKTTVKDTLDKQVPTTGPYQSGPGGYGAFRGNFSVLIKDEEGSIGLRKWTKLNPPKQKNIADQLVRILSKKEHEHLFERNSRNKTQVSPSQLVGYIYDYISEEDRAVDVNAPKERWGRDFIGDKRSEYVDNPAISPKKAPFDSQAELRLVPHMNDGIYNVLDKTVTTYGEGENINILTANDQILASVFYVCAKNRESSPLQRPGFDDELVAAWNRKKNEGTLEISAEGLIALLEENGVEVDKEECNSAVGTSSKTFTVKSTAQVGNVTRTLLVRMRSAGALTSLFQFQYL